MPQQPNDASRKNKAEGDRWSPDSEAAGPDQRSGYRTDEEGAGITNRSLDEEIANQESLPRRGESQPGAHAGHGDSSNDLEVMPSDDTTLNTKI
jgi:hypothetical protein